MNRYLKRLLVVIAFVALVIGSANSGRAEVVLPGEIQSALAEAAAKGDDALLEAVDAAVRANPELAQAIVEEASRLNPELEQAAFTVAIAAGADLEVAPAAGPAGFAFGPVLAGTGAAGAGGALAVGGAGGGSGGGDAPPTAPPSNPGAPPSGTNEFDSQEGLALINAADAYDRGLTGDGVVVAVLDTGLDVTHSEFVGQIEPGGYDFVGDTSSMTDPNGHGTHVSGIIGARKDDTGMHGVAYGATILPVRIIDADGFIRLSATELAAAIDYAVANGAVILNNSWGTPVDITSVTKSKVTRLYVPTAELNAYQRAVDADTIIIFAAGNSEFANPGIEAGLPYHFSDLEDLWIAVVAVDLNGQESSFTNRCGAAAAWCMAAPGGGGTPSTGINSTLAGGGYGRFSGTSMATPHVSGAVAILIEKFPGQTPEQIVDRLFVTADRSGVYANSAIFGNGLLDLEAATQPLGNVVVLTGGTVDGPAYGLTDSTVRLGSAFGDGLQNALGGARLAVFDEYNATFFVDLASFVQSSDGGLDFDRILQRFGKTMDRETVAFGDGRLSYALNEPGQSGFEAMAPGLEPETELEELSITSRIGDGSELTVNYNTHPALGFGLHRLGAVERSTLVSTDAFSAPYLSFAERGYNFATVTEIPRIGTLVVGSFFGQPDGEQAATSFGSSAELAVAVSARINVSFQLGVLVEEETFLGSETEGAFDMTDGVPTYFSGVTGEVALTDRFGLVGSVYTGVSYPSAAPGSMFSGFSPIYSQSFTLGIVGNGVIDRGDRVGLMVNQPLRVTGGTADISLATGRDRAGNIFRETFSADLAADGRELDLEAFYSFALARNSRLTASAMLRSQPGHIKNADSEGVVLFRLEHEF